MKALILIPLAFTLSLAAERYGVYDVQGRLVSTFEAEWFDLTEKTRQVKQNNPYKRLYVSSLKKGKGSKPVSRYRYKMETGAYIEASREETFSVCPEEEIEGTWVSEHSVYLSEANCLSVQAPNLAGTFRLLFLQNSGQTDTIQVLVEQSYIQMGDYSHKAWVYSDSAPEKCMYYYCEEFDYGHYENKKYAQSLIVDKTEFTMRDAQHYSQFGIRLNPWLEPNREWGTIAKWAFEAYPPKENLKTSMRPYLDYYNAWEFANMRSKLEGLDTVYSLVLTQDGQGKFVIDTNASGYRLPFWDEWGMLMRAGASTRYYWGDEEDSLTVSRYTQVQPIGYTQHKVAQKLPNAFGLYDMISPNNTNTHNIAGNPIELCASSPYVNQIPECRFLVNKVARQIRSSEPTHAIISIQTGERKEGYSYTISFHATTRLLRKTPNLHKLEKF